MCVSFSPFNAYTAVDTSNDSVWDAFLVATIYKTAAYVDTLISPESLSLPSPYLYTLARFSLWALYAFANGLVMTGLWVVAHECGHQAFSESKFINNAVGWVLHSGYAFAHTLKLLCAKHALSSDLASRTTRGVSATLNTTPRRLT